MRTAMLPNTNIAIGPLRSRRPCGREVTDQSAAQAETLEDSHILLGVDAAVSGQLVSLRQLSNALLQVLHLGIHSINCLRKQREAEMKISTFSGGSENSTNVDSFHKGNGILCCSEILLKPIKVWPESFAANIN